MPEIQFKETHDGSKTLYRPDINETYHSIHGALQESQHVFIQEGLAHYPQAKELVVFEMGLGTGLNALLAYDYADKHGIKIHYYAIEAYPITLEESQAMQYDKLIEDTKVFHQIHEAEWNTEVVLCSNFSLFKINNLLEDTDLSFIPAVDVIFYDAFAPAAQAHLWEPPILLNMFNLLKRGGHLTTYCAKGQFKRNLKSVNFEVKGVPGPPGKREMTIASKK